MTDLLLLAERCESLTDVDRHSLEYLFRDIAREVLGGPRPKEWEAERAYVHAWQRFFDLMRAEAWLDAALTLVPEGWAHGAGDGPGGAWAWVAADDERTWVEPEALVKAATPALALTAACLRARSTMEGLS